MSDTFEFEDHARVERLTGTLHDPAATAGDVLTVQADKSIAAAPGGGGGSGGGVLLKTYTAAEIAARWSVPDTAAAMELALTETQWVAGVVEIANTLDQNVITQPVVAYDSGAATTDVISGGDTMGFGLLGNSGGTYATGVLWFTGGGGVTASFLVAGKQGYATFLGDAAPTTGSVTVAIIGS